MTAHLLLTPELSKSLVSAVRRGVPIETAATAARVSVTQFNEWLLAADRGTWRNELPMSDEAKKLITAFAADIRVAQAEFEADQVENIAKAGAVVGRSGVPEWRARAWLLNNHPRTREAYRQHREVVVEQSGTVKHEHSLVRSTDPGELESWFDALKGLPEPDR